MSDNLGFLIADTARMLRRSFDERARARGVTRPQWRVLAHLHRNDGCTQISLADALEVEPITVGRMIDRLQDLELVERRADPLDRRAWRIHLTAKGESVLSDLRPIAKSLFDEALDGISPSDQADLEAKLLIIRSNLSRRQPEVANG